MDKKKLKEVLRLHDMWLRSEYGGKRADLQYADLKGADLQGADLDYSCWTLWCGSLDVKVDRRIAAQMAYHFCRLDCDDPDYINARNALMNFANSFHRVDECGRLR